MDDHPLNYIDFEGTIPEGEYGAGTVEIWDKGNFELANLTDKMIALTFHGDHLHGSYRLIHTKDKNWLIFKARN